MLRVFALIAITVSAATNTQTARAQGQRREYFEITNVTGENISVSMRARGGGRRGWQKPIKVAADETVSIPLEGYEPFDITIREANGKAFVFERVKLCTFMEECASYGQRDWIIRGREWQRETVNGMQVDRDARRYTPFEVTADRSRVKMTFPGPVAGATNEYPGQRPPPPKPAPGGPRR